MNAATHPFWTNRGCQGEISFTASLKSVPTAGECGVFIYCGLTIMNGEICAEWRDDGGQSEVCGK